MQRIFKCCGIQNIILTPDKELNILIYRTPSCVIIWKSYTLLKMVQFFWPTLYILCPRKKRPTRFCNRPISYKTRAILMKYGHRFPNKVASNRHKRFPPHLNSVSTLPCETWNAHCASATVELLQKKTPDVIPPHLWPPSLPDLNPVDNRMRKMLQEKVYKTRITDPELSTTLLTNGFRNGDIAQL